MKRLSTLVCAGLMLAVIPVQTTAQSGEIDMDRLNRDIQIMEGVLTQLFELDSNLPGSFARSSAGSTSVQGTYLPGYGIIFTIPGPETVFSSQSANISEMVTRFREANIRSSPSDLPAEIIEEREDMVEKFNDLIADFFADYGPAIGQLQPEDQILLVHGKSLENMYSAWPMTIVTYQNEVSPRVTVRRQNIPVISKSVSKGDLDALRNGQINRSTFENRIETVSENPADQEELMDLELFANILQTALKSNGNEEPVMNRTPTWFYLDNFGVFFQGQLSLPSFRAPSVNIIGYGQVNSPSRAYTESEMDSVGRSILEGRYNVGRISREEREDPAQLERLLEDLRSEQEGIRGQLVVQQAQQDSVRQALITEARVKIDNRLGLIKELMVDYGRTLSSLDNDQSLLIALDIQGQAPEKVHMRINKSDIEEMESGAITRQQAMDRITVTRE